MVKEKYDLYGNKKQERVEYEVVKLPLQDYVSKVRKFSSKSWRNLKVRNFMLLLAKHYYFDRMKQGN